MFFGLPCIIQGGGNLEERDPAGKNGPQHSVKLGLGEKRTVEGMNQRRQNPAVVLLGAESSPKTRSELRVVAELTSSRFFVGSLLEIKGEEDIVRAFQKVSNVGVKGRHGCTELGAGQQLSVLDRISVSFAGDGPYLQIVEEALPKINILEQMKGGGNADGDTVLPLSGASRGEGSAALLEEIETGGVVVNVLPCLVIPPTQEAIRYSVLADFRHAQLAVVGAKLTGLGADGDGFSMEIEPAKTGSPYALVRKRQGGSDGAGQVAVPRHVNGLAEPLLEGGDESRIPRGRALK